MFQEKGERDEEKREKKATQHNNKNNKNNVLIKTRTCQLLTFKLKKNIYI